MSAAGGEPEHGGACSSCLRRSWLLSQLSAPLDYQFRTLERLTELLALSDEHLLRALGGRRRTELTVGYAHFEVQNLPTTKGAQTVCRHRSSYPRSLRDAGSPPMLNVEGGVSRLAELTAAPTVAIVGSSRASDYGVEMAKSLARGLAASGVTVAGGLDAGPPAKRRSLYERVRYRGCGVAELPRGSEARRWGLVASQRILVRLAQLVVVVEAREHPGDLAGARIARALGRPLAAIPGRVTSPASSGTNALLLNGAHLVRGPADALELLFGPEAQLATARAGPLPELDAALQTTLERVGEGRDTPEKLTREGGDCGAILLALSELELMGMLARGDGGRYVPRHACLHDPTHSA